MSDSTTDLVAAAGLAARRAHESLVRAKPRAVTTALRAMARLLVERAEDICEANAADVEAAGRGGLGDALIDRLRLDAARLGRMAAQIETLAQLPDVQELAGSRALGGGLAVWERRRPVGVVGANYEARPNVTVDVASQLVKSRNCGVLRTGSAALGSAEALIDRVIAPALAEAGLDPGAVQLVRSADRGAARALVAQPRPDPPGDPARQRRDHRARSRARPPPTACARWPTPTAAGCCSSTRAPTSLGRSR